MNSLQTSVSYDECIYDLIGCHVLSDGFLVTLFPVAMSLKHGQTRKHSFLCQTVVPKLRSDCVLINIHLFSQSSLKCINIS